MPTTKTMTFAGVEFAIQDDPTKPLFFVLGIRKSGSSIMNSMVTALAKLNALQFVDVPGKLFESGVRVASWQHDAGLGDLLCGGNVYGGFRDAPLGIVTHPLVSHSLKILLVRDPRDALVSEYFSNAYAHKVPGAGEMRDQMLALRSRALRDSVTEYVMRRAPFLLRTIAGYDAFLDMPGLRLFRYEEAIMDKRTFLRDICDHFQWQVSDLQLDQILGWADVMPTEEDPQKFVRRVRPGDHLDKLDPEAIAKLNEIFAEQLDRFGYAR
ncbi:sulfotransferase domain-containing protein [Roseomonas sp. HJA6]|uniref:Sulfotransferase domain-containing protein n=1 Tax=Roseomonas alba TaxID=2846776 RepID=A0ABS7AC16_9PROT|nr:sulfotransferase domain-containing protein [Neoroseomonas alba]MBW6398719.1 sulfotransferase domain-containing protein [Neoroseomonas alba]